jgi:transcriptional regulator with XRE-family HTH domain
MSRRRHDPDAMRERGKRLAEIRNALGLTQEEMVPKLNAAARKLGLPESYKYYTVSRNESGTISFEDATVWLSLDSNPAHGWDWFVRGTVAKRGKLLPRPGTTTAVHEGKREA